MMTLKGAVAALAMALLAVGAVQAQSWSYGGMSGMQSRVANWADHQAYYIEVRYQGVAPHVNTRINGRMLDVLVQQVSSRPGSFMTGSSTKRIPLPVDADLQRMRQHEEPGRLVLVIPRRTQMRPGW